MGHKTTVRHTIDKQERLVLTAAGRCLMFDDVREHHARLLADPEFDASLDELIDASIVTKIGISADEVRSLAHHQIFSPKSRRAIVAAEPHIFSVARMVEIYHEDVGHEEVKVFCSMNEALKWLGREEEKHQNHDARRTDSEGESVSKRQ
jgi:hypothetical protein